MINTTGVTTAQCTPAF